MKATSSIILGGRPLTFCSHDVTCDALLYIVRELILAKLLTETTFIPWDSEQPQAPQCWWYVLTNRSYCFWFLLLYHSFSLNRSHSMHELSSLFVKEPWIFNSILNWHDWCGIMWHNDVINTLRAYSAVNHTTVDQQPPSTTQVLWQWSNHPTFFLFLWDTVKWYSRPEC
jgi:hypothetical protein